MGVMGVVGVVSVVGVGGVEGVEGAEGDDGGDGDGGGGDGDGGGGGGKAAPSHKKKILAGRLFEEVELGMERVCGDGVDEGWCGILEQTFNKICASGIIRASSSSWYSFSSLVGSITAHIQMIGFLDSFLSHNLDAQCKRSTLPSILFLLLLLLPFCIVAVAAALLSSSAFALISSARAIAI